MDFWSVLVYIAFRKKITALAKEKECEIVGDWKKSLVNHLYWSAVSTPDGNGELIEAKWISQDNHIHNKHKGHGKVFQACQHKPIRKRAGKKKWFKPCMLLYMHITYMHWISYKLCIIDTKASEKISSIILNKRFCSGVQKLSPVYQTSTCEAFHSVVNNFAPKSTAFTYDGMRAR